MGEVADGGREVTPPGAAYWIRKLRLAPHPEGGCFRETYRSAEAIRRSGLPARYAGRRAFSTAILFLLKSGDRSCFHRLKSDELWHFHAGDACTIHVISRDGRYSRTQLGPAAGKGECFQAVVPAGEWFGATVAPGGAYALMGCTTAPGFDFADFEMAERGALLKRYPRHRRIIERLTEGESRYSP